MLRSRASAVHRRDAMTEPPVSSDLLAGAGSRRWLGFGLAVGVGAIALLVIASDGRAIAAAASRVRPAMLLLPVACTVGSYAAMALSYQRIALMAGLDLPFPEMRRSPWLRRRQTTCSRRADSPGLALRSYFFSQQHGHQLGKRRQHLAGADVSHQLRAARVSLLGVC